MRIAVLITVTLLVLYLSTYMVVRKTHTQRWFDRTTEESGEYTLFDSYSQVDRCLYVLFYPACALEQPLSGRSFEKDKQ